MGFYLREVSLTHPFTGSFEKEFQVMPRVKRAVNAKKNRRSVLKASKGYRGARGNLFRSATEAVDRARSFAYRDRRTKKRVFRRLWIARINAAARQNDITYSRLIQGLIRANVGLDRKTLSQMAINDPAAFTKVVSTAKSSLGV